MSKPTRSHMEAYLSHLETRSAQHDKSALEAEYLRSIYKVLPRKRGLEMSVKQARSETIIRP